MSHNVSGASTRWVSRVTVGLLCLSRADTAFTFRPLCSQWRGAAVAEVWFPSPLTPVPVATVTRPTAAIPWVIHLAAVRSENWNTLFKGGGKPTVYRL